jgi:hypothetical protein
MGWRGTTCGTARMPDWLRQSRPLGPPGLAYGPIRRRCRLGSGSGAHAVASAKVISDRRTAEKTRIALGIGHVAIWIVGFHKHPLPISSGV